MKRPLLALLISALAFGALFAAMPSLDLTVSGWFYEPGRGFPANQSAWVRFIYVAVLWASRAVLVLVALAFLASLVLRNDWAARQRAALGFLVLAFVLGPGLIVDLGLKDNWGRARPHQIAQFGGSQSYTPPLVPSDQCEKNCSFVSGHASAGYAVMAFGLLASGAARRRWFIAGLVLGTLAGAVRVMQGGHFMSDVIFSFYFTLLGIGAAALLFRVLRVPLAPSTPSTDAGAATHRHL